MHELKKAIERVFTSTRGEDEVLVTPEELKRLHAKPSQDFAVPVTFVETDALEHLRSVYEPIKDRL